MPASDDLPHSAKLRPGMFSDLSDVLHVRQTQEGIESGAPFTSAESLAATWEALESRLPTQVWVAVTADGRLVACAELARSDQVFQPRLWVLPAYRDVGLEPALLARTEQQACTMGREEGAESVQLFAQATSYHPEAQEALAQSDFAATSTYEAMQLTLREPPTPPDDIAGVVIHPFAAGQDAEAVYRADEDAFLDERGHTHRTFERWKQRLTLREDASDPPVWLIAWDNDEVAGAALGEVIAGVGWIHHLGVRRSWRRRGLGAALILSALGAFHQRGIDTVRLNVDAASLTNAQHLYRRLGFQVTYTYTNYARTIPLVPGT